MSINLDDIFSAVAKEPACIVARIIAEHDEDGRLEQLFNDPEVPMRALADALRRQGVQIGKTAIGDHRRHLPCP